MSREIKFKFHFDNHAPVVLTLEQLMHTDPFGSLLQSDAGMVIAKRQFTGLLDKNGKEIFEGDIVKWFATSDISSTPKEKIGEVKWEKQACRFLAKYKQLEKHFYKEIEATYGDGKTYQCDYLEILGNIYENPELLK